MKYQKECQCCGQSVTAYTHNINRQMIEAFIKLIEQYDKKKVPVNINQELGLDHNQKCNLPKLQYYGLIVRTPEGWLPTKQGHQFYYAEIGVLSPVATMGNELLSEDHEAWKTHEKKRKTVFINDIVANHYKRREEYQEEKSKQERLFDTSTARFQ